MTKFDMGGEESKIFDFFSDILFEWLHSNFLKSHSPETLCKGVASKLDHETFECLKGTF